jgi:hypothetical protein
VDANVRLGGDASALAAEKEEEEAGANASDALFPATRMDAMTRRLRRFIV